MKCELLVVTETSSKIREQAAVRTFRLGHPLVWIKLYKPSILKAVKESLLQFQKRQLFRLPLKYLNQQVMIMV